MYEDKDLYTTEWQNILKMIEQAKKDWENRAYPDTEADGFVFCGKCGKCT